MSVFDLHPNALPPRRDYFGKLVPTGIDYYNQLKEMSRGQNLRRFKTSNFKDKSLVLEDDHLQVGFKSKPIYEMQEGHLRIFLRITLFFGNKGDEKLSNVEIEYEGDESKKFAIQHSNCTATRESCSPRRSPVTKPSRSSCWCRWLHPSI